MPGIAVCCRCVLPGTSCIGGCAVRREMRAYRWRGLPSRSTAEHSVGIRCSLALIVLRNFHIRRLDVKLVLLGAARVRCHSRALAHLVPCESCKDRAALRTRVCVGVCSLCVILCYPVYYPASASTQRSFPNPVQNLPKQECVWWPSPCVHFSSAAILVCSGQCSH